jgi:hypothetical protein
MLIGTVLQGGVLAPVTAGLVVCQFCFAVWECVGPLVVMMMMIKAHCRCLLCRTSNHLLTLA